MLIHRFFDANEAWDVSRKLLDKAILANTEARQEKLFERALIAEIASEVLYNLFLKACAIAISKGKCRVCFGEKYIGFAGDTCFACEGSGWEDDEEEEEEEEEEVYDY